MEKTDKYNKAVEFLKENKPLLENKKDLVDQIVARIQDPGEQAEPSRGNISHYLFGWADVPWVRRAMAIAATILIGVFIIQQA